MADYAKRPEVTTSTMGKLHNPSGEGVRAMSTQVKDKTKKLQDKEKLIADEHETKCGEEGSAKRNITRKKTDGRDTGNFDSRNKKQGGHGKGKWSDDDFITEDAPEQPMDENDPLYDETKANYVLTSHEHPETRTFDPAQEKALYGPLLTQSEFKLQVKAVLNEYFDSCDADEVIRSLEELQCREYHPDVVKKAISMSLDKHPRERELVSRLLTCLHPAPLADRDMESGFNLLLDSMEDLSTDVPEAIIMVANFLARAVVDEVLPPAYLSEQNNSRPGDAVIEKAVSLLSREHCTARLERIWGPGDGRPVAELKVEMDQILAEYLLSRELDEAARCVKELDAAHYMHELVKRGVKIAMEQDGKDSQTQHAKSAIDAMAALFTFLVKNAIISEHQVAKGVDRLHRILEDLKLDVPAAPTLLQDFEILLKEEVPAEEKKQ
jgi:programmed cell death protein 4